jgi:hypothetical protein
MSRLTKIILDSFPADLPQNIPFSGFRKRNMLDSEHLHAQK